MTDKVVFSEALIDAHLRLAQKLADPPLWRRPPVLFWARPSTTKLIACACIVNSCAILALALLK